MKIRILFLLSCLFAYGFDAAGQQTRDLPRPDGKKSSPAKEPEVSEIIARYAAAIGGRAAAEKIKSRSYVGKVSIPQIGITGKLEGHSMPEARSVTRIELPGLGIIAEGYDGTTGWSVEPMQGYREKTGEELTRQKLLAHFYREFELEKIYDTLEYAGKEAVNGEDAYVIRASVRGTAPDVMYFDAKTGLLVRLDTVAVSPAGRIPITSLMSDYRETDGIKLPFRTTSRMPQYDLVITLDEIKHNVEMDANIFAPPKK